MFISGHMPIDTKAHFSQYTGICVGRKKKIAWGTVWAAVIWALWLHRNSAVLNAEQVLDLI